jgi:hypothetical protein
MDCCSSDVGDCQKCHPEMWIQKAGSYCNWVPKVKAFKSVFGGSKGMAKPTPFNRTRSKPVRPRVRTQKKRTV